MTRLNGNEVVDPLSLLEKLQNFAYQKGYNQALLDMQAKFGSMVRALANDPHLQYTVPDPEWPDFKNNILTFNGKSVIIRGSRYALLLQRLLEARGEVISTQELLKFYGGKDALKPAIYQLRKIFKQKMPEVVIVSAGKGYRVAINSCP